MATEYAARGYVTLAPDMIGYGFSAKPRDYAYSIPDQASLHEALGGFERTFLKSILARCAERVEAARMLGISRQALHQKIVRYGL